MITGKEQLHKASWLLGFDFDGTLADITDDHSISEHFFNTLENIQTPYAWGICTGRSLEFLLEGLEKSPLPAYPDFIVAQERDLFYRVGKSAYLPDEERNTLAKEKLSQLLRENSSVLSKVKKFIETSTNAEWIEIPSDPAGIIASSEDEIQKAVDVFHKHPDKTDEIDYQRNTIYLRFSHKEYCKGTAIQYLQEAFEIPWKNTLVMGDNYNDITMLNSKIAKYYAAPKNSIPSLIKELQASDGLIASMNYADGVAEIIQHVIINAAQELA